VLQRVLVAYSCSAAGSVHPTHGPALAAGAGHGFPDRFDFARQRLAWFMGKG